MAMNDNIYVMREAIGRLTQMLAGRGIQVTQRGITASVKADASGRPFLVNLPFIPDNASVELIDAIQGFLDHEVAHILFTDFNTMGEAMKVNAGGMLNIIEDARIEKAMQAKFSGSGENLSRTGKFFLDKYTTPRFTAAAAAGDDKTVQAVLIVPLIRMMAGQQIFKEYMTPDKMLAVKEVYDKIKDLAPSIEAASSSKDCLEIAKEITTRLKPGAAPKPAPAPKAPKTPPAPKPPKPPADDEEASPAPADPDGEGGEPGDPDDADIEAGDTEAGDGDDMKAPEGDEDDDSEAGGPDEAEAGAGDADDEEHDIADSAGASWEAIDKETKHDFDDTISSLLTNSAGEACASSDYLIYTKDKDVVEPLKVGRDFDPIMLTNLQDEVDHMVAPLQKDLERAISARSLASYQPGQRSGRLHAANLSRLATGDDRVFRRRVEVTSKDVAVELVVDCSGSMSGKKIKVATQAAYALASVLERIGIPCEVIGFTTGMAVADHGVLMAEAKKIGREYSRYESLYMPVLKSFNERMTIETKKRFGWLPHTADLRNNVDGECVEIAARRLMARREKGKIMMVLSDGAPHAAGATRTLGPHLKKTIENVTRAGVNVIGIGIASRDVAQFYPKFLVINDVTDLPSVVMKELRALILK